MQLRGTLKAFNTADYTATVQLYGPNLGRLDAVKVSRGLSAAEMVAGRTVIIDSADHFRLSEAVVVAVF